MEEGAKDRKRVPHRLYAFSSVTLDCDIEERDSTYWSAAPRLPSPEHGEQLPHYVKNCIPG